MRYVRKLLSVLEQIEVYERNAPNFRRTYDIPFSAIKEISAPTLLCGPIGKDAHKVNNVGALISLIAENGISYVRLKLGALRS